MNEERNNIINSLGEAFIDILKSQSIKENLDDTISAMPELLTGNPISYFSLLKNIIDVGINIPNSIFYAKLDRFFRGIEDIPYDIRIKYIDKYINGKEREFAKKIIYNIDLIDDENKALIIANLQRALFYEKIDIGVFFRLMIVVRETTLEDLYYLLKHKNINEFVLNIWVSSLEKNGLMYNYSMGDSSVGSLGKSHLYHISTLGNILIDIGLNYGNIPIILEDSVCFFSKTSIEVKEPQINITTKFA